jgi:fermentation-respiration switch protein FrsA (DUF1100 family)
MNDTWVAPTADGVLIARRRGDGLLVDRPAQRRYRQPHPLLLRDGAPEVDGVVLVPMAPFPTASVGWYEQDGRLMLLTHFAEPYFGEPMVLLAEGDAVTRVYPLGGGRLVADDGRLIDVYGDRIRLDAATFVRSSRYVERPVSFHVGDVRLAGTVIVPNARGPHPAAVVLHGAAGGQRDFCRLHATALLQAGLAVLIYDKAGHGESGGTQPSIFDQAAAASAAIAGLAAEADIDAQRIGLAGFSNGMWAAPMVAGLAFVAGLGAPGVSMAESEVHRRTKILRDVGVGPDTLAVVAEAWRAIFVALSVGGADNALAARLDRALRRLQHASDLTRYEPAQYVLQNPMLSPIPPPIPVAQLLTMLPTEPDPELDYHPAIDYARLRCPVLLQYGAQDTSVPVTESVTAIRQARPDATLLVYPGLEHMLNIVPTDLTGLSGEEAMYQFHEFRFGPTVFADLVAWLRTHVVAPAATPSGWPAPTTYPHPEKQDP